MARQNNRDEWKGKVDRGELGERPLEHHEPRIKDAGLSVQKVCGQFRSCYRY